MDHPNSFSVTIHPSYFIRMATDKQAQAVQETTILRSRYYTKASMKTLVAQKSVPYLIF